MVPLLRAHGSDRAEVRIGAGSVELALILL
jgi:hypothetical protein